MSSGSVLRRALALIAAYAIALQPLWAAFALPATAGLADAHVVICLAGMGGADQPASNGGACACPCVMPGCGMAGCAPGVALILPLASPSRLAALSFPERSLPPAATYGPHLPRAPPIV